ncbi:MAG: ribosome-recycling factor, partial [Dehalococcoidia bacterium]
QAIDKAIRKSDLGLNPSSDGNVIRLMIPALTEERRKDLVKVVRKRVEEGRVAVRNIRREALEKLREMQKAKEISEDDEKRALTQLQALTDKFIESVNTLGDNKEQEVLET